MTTYIGTLGENQVGKLASFLSSMPNIMELELEWENDEADDRERTVLVHLDFCPSICHIICTSCRRLQLTTSKKPDTCSYRWGAAIPEP